MHQRVNDRPYQHAKYSRMEQIDLADHTDADVYSTNPPKQASTKTTPRSPLLEPVRVGAPLPRMRNSSTKSGDSFTDDLAAIEAAFADAEWIVDEKDNKNKNKTDTQRLAGFPTSLPSLITSPISNDGCQASSTSRITGVGSPSQRLRIYVDGVATDQQDADGAESMAASVYDNCTLSYRQSQTIDNATTETNSWRTPPTQLQLELTPNNNNRLHPIVTFVDQASSADNLSVPVSTSRRKSGSVGGGGSAPNLIDGQQVNLNSNGARSLSARRRSRSPSPRCSIIDPISNAPLNGGSPVTTPDDSEKKESKGVMNFGISII